MIKEIKNLLFICDECWTEEKVCREVPYNPEMIDAFKLLPKGWEFSVTQDGAFLGHICKDCAQNKHERE